MNSDERQPKRQPMRDVIVSTRLKKVEPVPERPSKRALDLGEAPARHVKKKRTSKRTQSTAARKKSATRTTSQRTSTRREKEHTSIPIHHGQKPREYRDREERQQIRMTPDPLPAHQQPEPEPVMPSQREREPRQPLISPRTIITSLRTLIIIGLLVALGYYLTTYVFDRGQVTVAPKIFAGQIDQVMTMVAEPSGQEFGFETAAFTTQTSLTLMPDAVDIVEEFATGTVTLFNEEPNEQSFVAGTRLESTDGLIFRILDEEVLIPAFQNGNPGTTEVTIIAEHAGDRYNIAPSDFTIPGWRESDSPKFSTQYARSTNSMNGGFVGERPVVARESLEQAYLELERQARGALVVQSNAEIPERFMMLQSGTFFEATRGDIRALDTGEVLVILDTTLHTILFERDEFAQLLARLASRAYNEEPVMLLNPDDVTIEVAERTREAILSSDIDSIRIRIMGTPQLEVTLDERVILEALSGVHVDEITEIVEGIPGIVSADIEARPLWKKTLPDNRDKIEITISAQGSTRPDDPSPQN